MVIAHPNQEKQHLEEGNAEPEAIGDSARDVRCENRIAVAGGAQDLMQRIAATPGSSGKLRHTGNNIAGGHLRTNEVQD